MATAIAWSLREPAVEVETAAVSRGPLVVTLDQEGRTHIEDRYVVSAPVTGFARRVSLLPGDAVQAGDALVELEPVAAASLDPRTLAEARADLARAEADARSAEADAQAATAGAERAKQRYERLEKAAAAGAVTQDDLDAAAAERRAAEAGARAAAFRAELARAGVAAARARVSVSGGTRSEERTIDIRAPVAACVLAVAHESEGVVQAGEPLLELGCRASLEIHADVLSADAVALAAGQRALIEDWGGSVPLQARLRRVEPQAFTKVSALGVEEQRVWVVLDLLDPPEAWSSLGDDYRVMVRFELWRGDDVLQVPAAAVFSHGDQSQVFVLGADGRLALRDVATGHRSAAAIEILAGLEVGEVVVSHPRRELSDGQRATPARLPGQASAS
ncbi:MAG: efflux transporter, family, subunit [Proteobacteria bacterium]|nr:efflux transporter, family, subunit [Pseudomonadota bacterium]